MQRDGDAMTAADFNGWADAPEAEREALEAWEAVSEAHTPTPQRLAGAERQTAMRRPMDKRTDLLLQARHFVRAARRNRLDGMPYHARTFLYWASQCRRLAVLHQRGE